MSKTEFKDFYHFYLALKEAWAQKDTDLFERLLREGKIKKTLTSVVRGWFSSYEPNTLDELLFFAAYDNSLEICQELFMRGALFDAPGDGLSYTAITVAAKRGHFEICRQFLIYNDQYQLKADLTPPLIRACRTNQLEMIELLLDHGADASMIDESNICNFRTRWNVLDCLIRNGALFNEDTLKIWEGEKPKRLKAEKIK